MDIPIELIKYVLFGIIIIVAGFKLFIFTKDMVKKLKNKKDDDFSLEKIADFDEL